MPPSKYVQCVATTTTVKTPATKRAPKSVPIKVNVTAPTTVGSRPVS